MNTKRILDLAVYLSVLLDLLVMLGVYFLQDYLVYFNYALAIHMTIIIFLAIIYTYLRRKLVMEKVKHHTGKTKDWLMWLIGFGGDVNG